ncbi:hypothetical protein [Sphingomonas pituitosa]|uniref:hypothetical protein n=1 Tax=Sphingomonas pituitosa TaxID=99597 RepID=UPI000B077F50|nr:hypothetical protein [Sphingomonas pituitosa]
MMRAVGRTLMYAPRSGGPVVLRLVVDPPNLLLHFAEGAGLPDPSGLLRGEGRRGRYVCFGALTAADYAPLLALIAAATGSSDTAREIDLGHKPSATA